MAWEHKLAQEFKKRNNSIYPSYLTGDVISPVMQTDPQTGVVSYSGPLIITIYDGKVRLEEKNLVVLQHCGMLHKGQSVALIGDQTFIVLGVT